MSDFCHIFLFVFVLSADYQWIFFVFRFVFPLLELQGK
ncbi:Hypothetical protein Ccan_03960 [Capnocytophaga canimorsus Cc5]|uniref:Uncharacterized protein n=1 Tax=Capnocytophaga canimorsus (strain 5) TaxID=860228 RepID=F9YRN9_CAPCC|nr:Hypothetical protein Ccan_03960 [Capnocytophaga canimorsus Cc5]